MKQLPETCNASGKEAAKPRVMSVTAWLAAVFVGIVVSLFSGTVRAAVVLQYHHVSDATPRLTSISPELFAEHLDYIAAKGFNVWPLPKLVASLKANESLPDKVISITFDDAYDSIYDVAYPLLKHRGWPFTVFVATEPVQAKIPGFMSWQQLKTMAAHRATIANHTHSHAHLIRRLPQESEAQWLNRVEQEILTAQQLLAKHLGQTPRLLAYPYGEYNPAIAERVRDLGFTAFGQQSGALAPGYDMSALPRFPMNNHYGAMDQLPAKVSSLPLPLQKITPDDMILTPDRSPSNTLTLLFAPLEGQHQQLRCYLSYAGEAKLMVTRHQDAIRVALPTVPAQPVGRSRINCTMPSLEYPGRFRWHSWFWMRPHGDGRWYEEP